MRLLFWIWQHGLTLELADPRRSLKDLGPKFACISKSRTRSTEREGVKRLLTKRSLRRLCRDLDLMFYFCIRTSRGCSFAVKAPAVPFLHDYHSSLVARKVLVHACAQLARLARGTLRMVLTAVNSFPGGLRAPDLRKLAQIMCRQPK